MEKFYGITTVKINWEKNQCIQWIMITINKIIYVTEFLQQISYTEIAIRILCQSVIPKAEVPSSSNSFQLSK